jgi:hypothetical protein
MNQKIRTFFKTDAAFWAVTLVLVLVAAIALYANLAVNFHLRSTEVVGGNAAAELINQRLRLEFNRPLGGATFQELVSIQPAADFKALASGANLFIYFNTPLRADTEYSVTLSNELKDVYGEVLGETKTTNFHTRQQHLAYVQKEQSGFSLQSWSPSSGASTKVVDSGQKVIAYDINARYAILIQEETEFVNQLSVVDRYAGTTRLATIPKEESTYQVQLIPGKNQFLATKEKVRYEQGYAVSDGGRKLFLFDIDSWAWREIPLELGITDIDVFTLSSDGGAVLVRDSSNAQYYLIDVSNPGRSFPLGKFVGGGDIDAANQTVIFTRLDPLAAQPHPHIIKVDATGKEQQLSGKGDYAIDPEFMNASAGAVWATRYKQLNGTPGLFELRIDKENLPGLTYHEEGLSLELPTFSLDDQFLAAESYTVDDLRSLDNIRVIGFQSKPGNADIKVYRLGETLPTKTLASSTQPTWY